VIILDTNVLSEILQTALRETILAIFTSDLAGQVLNFDSDAADAYAEIAATR
jgi:predicted nucleic acid-binding protein